MVSTAAKWEQGRASIRWSHTNPRKIDGPAVIRTLLDAAW
jgi:hypothetical protein